MSDEKTQYQTLNELDSLVKNHVDLSRQIKVLQDSAIAPRQQERIDGLEAKRWELHRTIERLGSEIGMSKNEVRARIVAEAYAYGRDNRIEGINVYPADFNGSRTWPRVFLRPKKFTGEYTAGDVDGVFLQSWGLWLDVHEKSLLPIVEKWIHERFSNHKDEIFSVNATEHAGYVHTEYAGLGIFIPSEIAEIVLTRLRIERSEWEAELRERMRAMDVALHEIYHPRDSKSEVRFTMGQRYDRGFIGRYFDDATVQTIQDGLTSLDAEFAGKKKPDDGSLMWSLDVKREKDRIDVTLREFGSEGETRDLLVDASPEAFGIWAREHAERVRREAAEAVERARDEAQERREDDLELRWDPTRRGNRY